MITKVNHVHIGTFDNTITSAAAADIGSILLFDKAGNVVNASSTAANGQPIRIGVKTGNQSVTIDGVTTNHAIVSYGSFIDPTNGIANLTGKAYAAPTEQVTTLNFANVVPEEGNRYVVRIQYFEPMLASNFYAKSYEVFANADTDVEGLVTSLAAAINRDPEGKVTATAGENSLTITAKPVTDNEGVDSINEYKQTSFEASVYTTTERDTLLYNNYYQDAGVVVSTTPSSPGDGNWKIVRDREERALSYKGLYNKTVFPVIKPKKLVVEGGQYYTIVLEYDNEYRSNDNQYTKTTPLTEELYVSGTGGANLLTALKNIFE